jgi:hypothetical protein
VVVVIMVVMAVMVWLFSFQYKTSQWRYSGT